MNGLGIVLNTQTCRRLERLARQEEDGGMRTRLLIIIHAARGWTRKAIAAAVCCSERTVGRVCGRWRAEGQAGLVDRREDNGPTLADEAFERVVREVISHRSTEYGHSRPTWTLRLIVRTAAELTGRTVSTSTMSRLLGRIGARWGRPKPLAPCPWAKRAIATRINRIRRLTGSLPAGEVAVWEDEADIDLNPRIGPDWMLSGTQRTVMTPGKNRKRYIAGAMDDATGALVWAWGEKKATGLFIDLLKKLLTVYASKEMIHVILDNFKIHSSKRLKAWLAEHGSRLRFHFLPPYCPDDNRIERGVWRDMHQNVTYNHQHQTLDEICGAVTQYLRSRNCQARRKAA
ncbi:MAG: IS630 family transposase [Phycisphaerae bacterium]|nr:IS630 family transposase [Phycisphaerae bacterium]